MMDSNKRYRQMRQTVKQVAKPNASRTIAFIGSDITEEIPRSIWNGLVEAAVDKPVNLVFIAGGALQDPVGFRRQANILYDLVTPQRIDGIIFLMDSIGFTVTQSELINFVDRYRSIPMVSIEQPLPGKPSVLKDDYQGIRDAISHLVEVHHRRRLVFLQGPPAANVAKMRLLAYQEALRAYGLPNDPNLVTPPGGWFYQDAVKLFRAFLAERALQPRFDFDAVIGVNDENAIAAITVLQSMGVRVPEDVSVTGFDDLAMAGANTPSLTTIRQPLMAIGKKALELLLDEMEGKPVPLVNIVPNQLIIRRSCGCLLPTIADAGIDFSPNEQVPEEQSLAMLIAKDRKAIVTEMANVLGSSDAKNHWVGQLLNGFIRELDHRFSGAFLSVLDDVLNKSAARDDRINYWQRVITVMQKSIMPYISDREKQKIADSLWHQARVMIGEVAWRNQVKKKLYFNNRVNDLWGLGARIAASLDLDDLIQILSDSLPKLGVSRCYLSLYQDPTHPLDRSRLILAYDKEAGQRVHLPAEIVYSTAGILPDEFWQEIDHSKLILTALYFREEPLGFLGLEIGGGELEMVGELVYALQMQISSSLKAISLHRQAKAASEAAEAGWRLAEERRKVAEEANELKSRFLSMVSHELRTPLNVIAGLSENLMQQRNGIQPGLPDTFYQDLERIYDCAQHLNNLIRDVLDLASSHGGQLKLVNERLAIPEVLRPVLVLGERMARDKGLQWVVEISPDLPPIIWDRTRFRQVVLNLLTNAIKFTDHGEVRLRVQQKDGEVLVSVSDTGMGIPKEEQADIFEEFRRSKLATARGYGGLGLGLAICRALVEMGGGKIWVESSGEIGGGSTFHFTIPACIEEEGNASAQSQRSTAVLLLTPRPDGNQKLIKYLNDRGFDLVTKPLHTTLDDNIQTIRTIKPGTIILDLEPSSEQGWEILSALKTIPSMQDVPVMVYTLLDNGDRGTVLDLEYLEKPLLGSQIAQVLQQQGLKNVEKHHTILIVDDDENFLDLHSRLVESQLPGCRIMRAKDGKQAMMLMTGGDTLPDLVMLDLMMPEMSGFEVLEGMRSNEKLRSIPVVVLTSQKLSQEDMQQLNLGVAAILSKGLFTVEETLLQIDAVLSRNKQLGSEAKRIARQAMAFIHDHYRQPISRKDIAAHISVSKEYLSSCFHQEVGVTLSEYIERIRIHRAKELLETTDMNITQIAMETGFNDSSYFGRVFRQIVGVSPIAYRRGESGR